MAKQPTKGRQTPKKPQQAPEEAKAAPESTADKAPVVDLVPAEVLANVAPKAPEKPKTPEKAPEKLAEKTSQVTKAAAPATSAKENVQPTPAPKPAAPPAPKPAPKQNNSFLPLAFGGLVAGVIGFAVATFTAPPADNNLVTQLSAQSNAISTVEQRIANLPETDLSGITAELADLTARLEALEARPATLTAPSADVSAVSADMDNLRAQIAEMTNAAQTELAEARAAAVSIEENAANAARNAAARAALSRVQTSLENGAPIGAALSDLEEATASAAPEALIAVQDGVPTLAILQDQFAEAARAALAAARSEGVSGEESSGIGAFLRTQFDVRSTSPRGGDDADAILSRAEAAVRTGRLSDALAEVSVLPEVSRAAMSDWLEQAESRASAVAAVDILSSTLTDN